MQANQSAMTKRIQIFGVEPITGTWEGRSYMNYECQCLVFGDKVEACVMKFSDKSPIKPEVGEFIAHFDLKVDRRTRLLGAVITDLVPLSAITAPATRQMAKADRGDKDGASS